jgi:hypothetical protein
MKITNTRLMEIIKEEYQRVLSEKEAKPDFLDLDKDGDTEEPMKKAAKEAEEEELDEEIEIID